MKIALIVPTRERYNSQVRLAESIKNTAKDINNVVLYYGVDDDDPIKEQTKSLTEKYSFIKIIEIHNNKEFLGLGKLWNIMANQIPDDIFSMIGDDMVFETKDWDERILERFNENNLPNDKLKLVFCNDGWNGKLAVNSFVHRRYYEIVGQYIREEWKHSYHDNWLQDVFTSINRIEFLNDVVIRHLHWSIPQSKAQYDKVYVNLQNHAVKSIQEYPYNGSEMLKKREDEIQTLKNNLDSGIDFSILILSMHSRKEYLDKLIACLKAQITLEFKKRVQILVNIDRGEKFIGLKRNELLASAKGKYVAFIDDDDLVSADYIKLVLSAIDKKPDVVGMHLLMTTDGQNECRTYHSIKYNTWYDERDPERENRQRYFRCPNHLNPVKREIALNVKYTPVDNIGIPEDRDYSLRLFPLLKTEEYIESPIYYYYYRSFK